MKAAIVSLGSTSSEWTVDALKRRFSTVDDLDLRKLEIYVGAKRDTKILYDGKPLPHYDCIYCKGSFRYADILRAITSALQDETFMPIKDSAYTVVHNKLLTHLVLQQADIPMPITYLTPTGVAAKKLLTKVNYPIVMKFPEGTQGKGVMFADSFASASSLLDALRTLKQPFIIQEYIETGGSDVRAIVVGNKVVAAMQRVAVQGEKRANIHAGGEGKPIILDEQTKHIAIKAAAACGAEICGVDILKGPKGPLVIELNISPGLQGIKAATGIDVAQHIADYLAKKTKEFKGGPSAEKMVKELSEPREFVANIQYKCNRIVLPEAIVKLMKFEPDEEVHMKVDGTKLIIERIGQHAKA
jgi:ribosomal protein S6--L-glutamate ligase